MSVRILEVNKVLSEELSFFAYFMQFFPGSLVLTIDYMKLFIFPHVNFHYAYSVWNKALITIGLTPTLPIYISNQYKNTEYI